MPMSAKLLVFSFCSSVFGGDESVSLLQMQATKKHGHAVSDAAEEDWANGFNQCRDKPLKRASSGCRAHTKLHNIPIKYPEGVDVNKLRGGAKIAMFNQLKTAAARDCSLKAKEVGSDTFDFLFSLARMKAGSTNNKIGAICRTKSCYTSNLRYKKDKKAWDVFSIYCGLSTIKKNITGPCDEETTRYLKFLPPPVHACDAPLQFGKGMKNNNLGGKGPGGGGKSMRFRSILQNKDGSPIDLVVKTMDEYLPANTTKNGRHRTWGGRVNLRSGTETRVKFQFVTSSGQTPVKVSSFMFTVFDLDQSRDCVSRTTINATGYSAYYVSDNTELKITTRAPKLYKLLDNQNKPTGKWHATPMSTQFQSTQFGNKKDNPSNPLNMDEAQAARAVTLVYQNVKSFTMGFKLTGGQNSGRNIIFGGSSSITKKVCELAHQGVEGLPAKE